jgi:hypothetical protein
MRKRPPPKENLVDRFLDQVLDPIDRLTASIYSILIVLTFTIAFSILMHGPGYAEPVPEDFGSELFFAVLGATVAWGLIDGIMFALLSMLERGEKHRFLEELQAAETDTAAVDVVADEFDYLLEPITSEHQRQHLYVDVLEHLRDSQPRPVGFQRSDLIEALGSAAIAVVAVIPSLLPLWLLRHDPLPAMRISNVISFIMLFILGYRWGIYTGANPWRTGLLLFFTGFILVAIAILLGG